MNEREFINKLRNVPASSQKVVLGIGDDAAVIEKNLIVTTDTLVENNHFSRKYFSPEQIGKKAVEVNVSDLVVMGGKSMYMVVTFACPREISVNFLHCLTKHTQN